MSLTRRLVILLAALGACHRAYPVEAPGPARRILFVGNSLTYFNDLPATVRAIALSSGDTIEVQSVTGGGLALIDHLTGSTNAAQVIAGSPWDYVVLQQGPTPAGICRDSLVLWTTMFDPLIRNAGAVPALFMTWPAASSSISFDVVHASFAQAAAQVGGVFLPAGEGWREAWKLDAGLALYGPDNFHPSEMGSFLAALVIYERLAGRDARDLPALAFSAGQPMVMSPGTVRLLQRAAHQAVSASRPAPTPAATAAVPARSRGC